MKNIHLIPTDKPNRVRIGNNGNFVIGLVQSATVSKNDSYTNQHIYITSDEEIKIGDWVYNEYQKIIIKFSAGSGIGICKKIILTTDQDLINDGVQAIDDEFLEWFVKNPNCEEVEVESWKIDKEWDKVHTQFNPIYPMKIKYKIILKEEPKQETLEEVAERRYIEGVYIINGIDICEASRECFIEGAKWQQQQLVDFSNINANNITTASTQNQTLWKEMYSEEDMKQFAWECVANFFSNDKNEVERALVEVIIDRNNQQFKQFKKK